MDIKAILELSSIIKSQGLSVIEVEENGTRIRLENAGGGPQPVYLPADQAAAPVSGLTAAAANEQPAAKGEAVDDSVYEYVKSPMVGLFTSLEKMGKPSLKPGDNITADMVVCGVEAMKMVCDVKAETSGSFVELMVNDGDQVEFGQQLIKLKKG